MKILVVDDNQTTRKLLGMYLKSRGLNVVFAENGLDAIEKLADPDVGLVLTDLNMPYMDGIEFVKTLRASPNWTALPVIVVTTEADPNEREAALKAGANGYLEKPVTADELLAHIKNVLKGISREGGVFDVSS